ncbi:MAG: hypothetical protein WC866_02950 [Patescibacteria group bacterium]|jgi:hypothetical protein
MSHPPVIVQEVTVERGMLVTTNSPNPINLGGEHNFSAALAELAVSSIQRALRAKGGRVFFLVWEGTKIPRGAQVLGHTLVWTQNGQVHAELAGKPGQSDCIGTYDRLEEWGGQVRKSHKMLVYVSPHFHPPVIISSS